MHVTSSSGKFGTFVSDEGKEAPQSKLLEAASKAVKIEMVWHVEAEKAEEEAARKATNKAEDEAAKQRPSRVQGKSPNFLTGREEVLDPELVEALPAEIRSAIESFYKFWTDRWQLHTSSCEVVDLTRALVSQSVRTFGLALECKEALTDFQTRTQSSKKKVTSLAEELKKAKAEVEESRAQKIEDAAKLESALAQIEALKKEVYESQCEWLSLPRK